MNANTRLYPDRLYRLVDATLGKEDEFVDLMLDQLTVPDCDQLAEALAYLLLRVSGRKAQITEEGKYQY